MVAGQAYSKEKIVDFSDLSAQRIRRSAGTRGSSNSLILKWVSDRR